MHRETCQSITKDSYIGVEESPSINKGLKMKNIAFCLFFCGLAMAANAETGQVESISGGTYQITANDFGDTRNSVFTTKLAGVVLKSDVSFQKQGSTFIAECGGVSTTDSKGSRAEGTCLVTDSDGDKYKLSFLRANVIGGNNPGTQEWTGLTGKYVGASGKCTYENKSQVLNSVVYGINPVKCNVSK
ncbi:MAG: hypothetical protein ACKO5X_06650 [Limnohabitans sp.]